MITAKGLEQTAKSIQAFLSFGQYVLNGVTKQVNIKKVVVTGSRIQVYLYLNSAEGTGNITKVQLVDIYGNIFAEKNDIINKPERKGLMVAFDITISEVS